MSNERCNDDRVERLIRNAESLLEGVRIQLKQLRRALRDPGVMADRVERAKAAAMENVAKALEQINSLDRRTTDDD